MSPVPCLAHLWCKPQRWLIVLVLPALQRNPWRATCRISSARAAARFLQPTEQAYRHVSGSHTQQCMHAPASMRARDTTWFCSQQDAGQQLYGHRAADILEPAGAACGVGPLGKCKAAGDASCCVGQPNKPCRSQFGGVSLLGTTAQQMVAAAMLCGYKVQAD